MIVTEKDRYIPSIGVPSWDIDVASKEERNQIKSNLVAAITHDEKEYKAVISYLHKKFPDLMDYCTDDGQRFQWRYHEFEDKVMAYDDEGHVPFDMYALVYYDASRDMEPIAIGGSYIRETGAIRDPYTHKPIEGQIMNLHTTKIRCGHGYILFVDPNYRRLGLARDQWLTEAQLYRDSDIHYQKENQTYAALKVTLSMFKDPSKCHILSGRSLDHISEGMNTKIIMDYFDDELVRNFMQIPEGLRYFRNPFNWKFLKRENLTMDDLLAPWKNQKKLMDRKPVTCSITVEKFMYDKFKEICYKNGVNVKDALIDYIKNVINDYEDNH